MEELNTKIPLFKKIDRALFDRIDKFKQTPNYTILQDFYNGLEEEQQKLLKGVVLLVLFTLPVAFIGVIMWQNANLRQDYELRSQILSRANEILAQNQGIREVGPRILSDSPIDSQSMMTSRLSNLLSSVGVDISKIQVKGFESSMISSNVSRAEADFSFNNVSTDELMNMFSALIQREKFRIQDVSINRSAETNLLQGQFHAIHFSSIMEGEGEEE